MMFPFISDHIEQREKSSPLNEKVKFDNQDQIIKRVSEHTGYFFVELGLCSAFSNLTAEARMKGEDPRFLEGRTYRQIYGEAKAYEKRQEKLLKKGLDGDNLAFLNKEHKSTLLDEPPMMKSGILDRTALLEKMGTYNLIAYPTTMLGGHQVYFEKGKEGQCKLLNVDRPGGFKSGDCDELIGALSEGLFDYVDKSPSKNTKVNIVSSEGS